MPLVEEQEIQLDLIYQVANIISQFKILILQIRMLIPALLIMLV